MKTSGFGNKNTAFIILLFVDLLFQMLHLLVVDVLCVHQPDNILFDNFWSVNMLKKIPLSKNISHSSVLWTKIFRKMN
jgi:hypothetical protein